MNRTVKIILVVGAVIVVSLVLLGLGAAAAYLPLRSSGPAPAKQETASTAPGNTGLPNPAAAYCEEQGYTLETRTNSDGGQYGVCMFPDGSECDEWAFYRGECGPTAKSAVASIPTLALKPGTGCPGQVIQVTGAGFVPGASIALRLGVPNVGLNSLNLTVAVADAQGAFDVGSTLPTVWPETQTPIVEQQLVIAAVDEVRGQTLAVAPFTSTGTTAVECFDDCLIFVRDTALAYIADHYSDQAPAPDLTWTLASITELIAPEGSPGKVTYQFAADGWTATISCLMGSSEPAATQSK